MDGTFLAGHKQLKLYTDFWKFLPDKYKDETCPKPPECIIKSQKVDQTERAVNKKKRKAEATQLVARAAAPAEQEDGWV